MKNILTTYGKYLATAALVLVFIVAPIGVGTAHAECGFLSGVTSPTETLGDCITFGLAWVAEGWLSFMAHLVWTAGILLNFAAEETVIHMGENIRGLSAIDTAWTAFRDLANIFLIFVLIAIGIATILRVEPYGAKKLLAKLIIVALLLNFSLFFTKFAIDATNLLAVQFWNAMAIDDDAFDSGLSAAFMAPMHLTSLYDFDSVGKANTKGGSAARTNQSLIQKQNPTLTTGGIFAIGIFGSILFAIAAFVFFAAAIMLIVRFAVLILLMIASPLAFVGMVLPGTAASMAQKWWSTLANYALFAPAYFALTWVSLTVLSQLGKTRGFGVSDAQEAAGFAGFALGQAGFVHVFLQFMIVITLMIASLVIAKQFGIAGGAGAVSIGKSWSKIAGGYVGARTAGWAFKGARAGYSKGASLARSAAERMSELVPIPTIPRPTNRVGRFLTDAAIGTAKLPGKAVVGAISGIDQGINAALKAGEDSKYGGSVSISDIIEGRERRGLELENIAIMRRAKQAADPSESRVLTTGEKEFLNTLNQKQLDELGATRLAVERIAQNLSANQLEGILKNEKLSEEEKAKIVGARFAEVIKDAKTPGGGKLLRALSDKETELMGNYLRDEDVIGKLSDGQRDVVKKSNLLNADLKQHVKEEWNSQFKKLLDQAEGGNIAPLRERVNRMTTAGLANLDDDLIKTRDQFTGQEVAHEHLMKFVTPAVMMEMAKSKNMGTKRLVRTHMEGVNENSPTTTKAEKESKKWLTEANTPFGMIF